jgi:hypothetical protein
VAGAAFAITDEPMRISLTVGILRQPPGTFLTGAMGIRLVGGQETITALAMPLGEFFVALADRARVRLVKRSRVSAMSYPSVRARIIWMAPTQRRLCRCDRAYSSRMSRPCILGNADFPECGIIGFGCITILPSGVSSAG